jgi:predicted alpha/beta-fold hydrolase
MQADSFRTPAWLSNRHVQTLGAALPLHAPRSFVPDGAVAERLEIPIGDAGFLAADAWWLDGVRRAHTAIVVHGVGGFSESRYVVRAARALHRAGYHVVRLNLRGAGAGMPLSTSLYHAGISDDLLATVNAVANDARVESLLVLGFSLGGNVTLKMAGEVGANAPAALRAIATVSAPLDFTAVSQVMESRRNLPYRAWVLKGLVGQALTFARKHGPSCGYDARGLWRIRSIRDYDTRVIVPMHGFPGVDEYYVRASCGPLLPNVRVPTLLVHADDDPIVPGRTVKPFLSTLPPGVEVAWTEHGGHVGWYSGFEESAWLDSWPLRRALEFFARHVDGTKTKRSE